MNEGERLFEQKNSPTREDVVSALSNITTVEESQTAAKLLGQFLETIDTSNMSRTDKLRINGILTHCRKPDAEIDNGIRYLEILNDVLDGENE